MPIDPEDIQILDSPGFGGYPAVDTPEFPTYRDYPSLKETGGLPFKAPIPLLGMAERTPRVILGRKVSDVPGLVEPGNIDLTNPGLSTKGAFHIEDGGMHVVLPGDLGKEMALQAYQKTGQNLGIFKDEKSADEYTQNLAKYQDLSTPKPYGLDVAGPKLKAEEKRRADLMGAQLLSKFTGEDIPSAPPPVPTQEELRSKDFQVGTVTPGNIDLDKLTPIETAGGDADTLAPIAITDTRKKQTVLIPTIIDGK